MTDTLNSTPLALPRGRPPFHPPVNGGRPSFPPCLRGGVGGVLYIFISALIGFAQVQVNLSGVVRDAQTGTPVANASVLVLGTGTATLSDVSGRFEISGLPAGEYELQVSHIGYEEYFKSDVLIREGETTFLAVAMKPAILYLPPYVVSTESKYAIREPSVMIIGKRELENIAGKDAGDALKEIAGATVLEEGGSGGRKIVSLRGARPEQVAVEVDGVSLNAASGGAVDLSQFPIEQIERIEIIRGGSSASVGSGAIGGLIRIITKKPDFASRSLALKTAATVGSFGYAEEMAQVQIPCPNSAIEFHLRHAQSKGDFTYDEHGTEKKRINNQYERWLGQVAGSWQIANRWQWNLLGSTDYRERGSPGMIAQSPTPEATLREQPWRFTSNLTWQHRHFETTLTNSYQLQKREDQSPREQYDPSEGQTYYHAPVWTKDEDQAWGASLIGLAQKPPLSNWTRRLSAGIHFRQDSYQGKDLLSSSTITDRSIGSVLRNTCSVQGQADFHLPRQSDLLQWITEGRIDAVDQTALDPDIHATGRFRMSAAPLANAESSWNVIFSGSYGSSYRLPSFVNLFLVESAFALGNKNLKSERGHDGDFGVLLRFQPEQVEWFSSCELSADAFWNRIEDMIVWRPNFRGQYFPDNLAAGETKGIELSGRIVLFDERLDLKGHGTFQSARNRTPEARVFNKVLPLQPEMQGGASMEWHPKPFELVLDFRAMGRRYTTEDNTDYLSTAQCDLKPFAVFDVALGWQKSLGIGKVALRGQVNNLFDEDYMIIERSPMPGRNYEIRLSFEK
jgi:vitamin B12 transporter